MNKKPIIIGACITAFVATLSIGVWGICERNKDAKTSANWCVELIKEKDLFKENKIEQYAYAVQETKYVNLDPKFFPDSFKDVFYIDMTYVYTHEKWLCFIDYDNTIWRFLKKEQVKHITCYLLERIDYERKT